MRPLYPFFLLISFSFSLCAQHIDTTWYDADNMLIKEVYNYKLVDGKQVKDGLYTIYHKNGKTWQTGHFKEDILQGIWYDYYESGALKQILPYSFNEINDTIKIFYEDSTLKQLIPNKNDKPHGIVQTFNESGSLIESTNYINGIQHDTSVTYHANGKKRIIRRFQQGQLINPSTYYYESGFIKEVSNKINEQYEGLFIGYFKQHEGIIQTRCNYKSGILNGPFIGYHTDGSKMNECTYENDEIHGDYIEYYAMKFTNRFDTTQQQVSETGKYVKGMKEGRWIAYYPDGSLYMDGEYLHDSLEGNWMVYYPDSAIKQEGAYHRGRSVGEWKFYYTKKQGLMLSGSYKEGKRVGEWKIFYPNEKNSLHKKFHYNENGKKEGIMIIYDEEGNVKEEIDMDAQKKEASSEEQK